MLTYYYRYRQQQAQDRDGCRMSGLAGVCVLWPLCETVLRAAWLAGLLEGGAQLDCSFGYVLVASQSLP